MPKLFVNPNSPGAWEIHLKPGSIASGAARPMTSPSPTLRFPGLTAKSWWLRNRWPSTNLGSTNGTMVNRASVIEAVLQEGDRIQLGGVELVYMAAELAAPTPAKTQAAPVRAAAPASPVRRSFSEGGSRQSRLAGPGQDPSGAPAPPAGEALRGTGRLNPGPRAGRRPPAGAGDPRPSAAAWRRVAQVSNLPYRGFPIRRPPLHPKCPDSSHGLPTGSRRYGRLEVCATPRAFGSKHSGHL